MVFHPTNIVAATYTGPLLLEFLTGAWLCRIWHAGRLPGASASLALILIGLAAFAWSPFAIPGEARALVWGIPSLLIVAGTLGIESAGHLPRLPGALLLGNASYALYLTHMLVVLPMLPLLRPYFAPLALTIMLTLCIGLALAVHWLAEEPIRRLLARRARLQRAYTSSSAAR